MNNKLILASHTSDISYFDHSMVGVRENRQGIGIFNQYYPHTF